jgi:hypothetical protein
MISSYYFNACYNILTQIGKEFGTKVNNVGQTFNYYYNTLPLPADTSNYILPTNLSKVFYLLISFLYIYIYIN